QRKYDGGRVLSTSGEKTTGGRGSCRAEPLSERAARREPRPPLRCALFIACSALTASRAFALAPDGTLVQFNDNGFWSWFQDERAIIDPATNQLLVSSIASGSGVGGSARDGNMDVASYNLNTGATSRVTLHVFPNTDDHNSAALLIRPDGNYLAVYQR